jgi:N-acetyl-anhydromuramyl-L-alanine amidase AmpD
MTRPIKLTVSVYSLFTVNDSSQPRWGSATSHPVADARVELEGTGLSATVGRFGHAQLDVSSLESGDYVLALTPHANNLLRNSGGGVTASDGNKSDKPGTCRYRPLRIQVSLKLGGGAVKVSIGGPCDGATHGAAFFQLPATLLIDWKPDWVACKHSGTRPLKTPPSLILLHRTESSTPGSALDTFIPSSKSSHYLVDVDGHVIKLVHEDLVANHAGISWWAGHAGVGSISVGIEIVNKSGPFTPQQYEAIAQLIRDLQRTYPTITRHGVLAHGDVRVRSTSVPINLQLVERAGCPGFEFDWTYLQNQGLCSKADPSLFQESEIDKEYGGYFKDKPDARLSDKTTNTTDAKLLRKDKIPYGIIASLQAELSSLGYSINASNGTSATGEYDAPTQAAVDRFRRRYMPGAVRSNDQVSPIFDRATAIALKRVVQDRLR